MATKRAFISFDYNHDEDLKILLAAQAKLKDSPFDFTDASVSEHLTGDWKEKVRKKFANIDVVIVLCGEKTDTATGVAHEVTIAQEESVDYFLLAGYSNKACKRPTTAKSSDAMYNWTWPNLKALIGGGR